MALVEGSFSFRPKRCVCIIAHSVLRSARYEKERLAPPLF
jgi:hypothetical protein